ncbi:MAG: Spo0E family sporulation regulatory protein-aspartic acid phosphatase [Tuberibacillus sp.]
MSKQGTTDELVKKIREKRQEVLTLSQAIGINHEKTLACSRDLDQLIIMWEKENRQLK